MRFYSALAAARPLHRLGAHHSAPSANQSTARHGSGTTNMSSRKSAISTHSGACLRGRVEDTVNCQCIHCNAPLCDIPVILAAPSHLFSCISTLSRTFGRTIYNHHSLTLPSAPLSGVLCSHIAHPLRRRWPSRSLADTIIPENSFTCDGELCGVSAHGEGPLRGLFPSDDTRSVEYDEGGLSVSTETGCR
jgi:hypothetical protein